MINLMDVNDLVSKRYELEFLMMNENAPKEEREKAEKNLKKHDKIMKAMEKVLMK